LPARLSRQQATIFRVDGRAFALPVELVELAQPFDPAGVNRDGPVPRVFARDQWVPLVQARDVIGVPPLEPGSCPKLLLVRADGGLLAVLVDSIEGTGELVVKPLGPLLSGHPSVAGTSLSVTGEIVLTLNPSGLARQAGARGRHGTSSAEARRAPRAVPVLVVDDSISVRTVVARYLRALGHEVEEASDGLEALGRLRTRAYGLVVSDLEMPRMDGFELLAELGRLEIAPAVPVVVASTLADPETRRKVLALGAREFLPKPIEPAALSSLVRDLLPAGPVGSVGQPIVGFPNSLV
jgi:CheY-like chemotaxis protein